MRLPTGPPTGIVAANAVLLDQLDDCPALAGAISAEKEWLQRWLSEEHRRETLADRTRYERFK